MSISFVKALIAGPTPIDLLDQYTVFCYSKEVDTTRIDWYSFIEHDNCLRLKWWALSASNPDSLASKPRHACGMP